MTFYLFPFLFYHKSQKYISLGLELGLLLPVSVDAVVVRSRKDAYFSEEVL
jgi:hypothetical protein